MSAPLFVAEGLVAGWEQPVTPAPSQAVSGSPGSSASGPSGPGADDVPLQDRWRHGLRFESADKDFSLFVGGRMQFDAVRQRL